MIGVTSSGHSTPPLDFRDEWLKAERVKNFPSKREPAESVFGKVAAASLPTPLMGITESRFTPNQVRYEWLIW
jgi:hypothetical protein